jgi:hypothetical protein
MGKNLFKLLSILAYPQQKNFSPFIVRWRFFKRSNFVLTGLLRQKFEKPEFLGHFRSVCIPISAIGQQDKRFLSFSSTLKWKDFDCIVLHFEITKYQEKDLVLIFS